MKLEELRELAQLVRLEMEGAIDAKEHERLEQLLDDDPEAQEFYTRFVALDEDLRWTLSVPSEAGWEIEPTPTAISIEKSNPLRSRYNGLHRPIAAAACLAAFVAGVLWSAGFFSPASTTDKPLPLARLVEAQGETLLVNADGETQRIAAGQELYAGQTIRTDSEEGFAVLEFADSTRLQLEADTLVRLADTPHGRGAKVFHARGLMRADVPRRPDDRPLFLSTPHADLVAPRSRFTSVIDSARTRVELEEGEARLRRQADGKSIAMTSGNYAVATLELEPFVSSPMPQQVVEAAHALRTAARSIAFTPDSQTLAIGHVNQVSFWNVRDGVRTRTLVTRHRDPRVLAFTSDGKNLASAGRFPLGMIWSLDPEEPRATIAGMDAEPRCVALSADCRLLAAAEHETSKQLTLTVRDMLTGTTIATPMTGMRDIGAVAFSADSQLVAASIRGGRVAIFEALTGKPVTTLASHAKRVLSLAFSSDSKLLATGSEDGTVRLWSVAGWTELLVLPGNGRRILSLAFSPDSSLLVGGTHDGTASLWNLADTKEIAVFHVSRRNVFAVAFSPNGQTLATVGDGKSLKLWQLPPP
jgi:ferric-dicitrate binding protein FerR (iron transport regulator)